MEAPRSPGVASTTWIAPLAALVVIAYIAGLLCALHEYPHKEFTRVWQMMAGDVGVNAWYHRRELADETSRDVVRPNNDTLYSSAALDLSQGPLLIEAPASDRYWALQFIRDNTDVFANIGSRELGLNHPARVLLVPAGFSGDTAEPAVIRAPSMHVWLLARFLVDGTGDLTRVHALQDDLRISRWNGDQLHASQ
jgi:hypothetical protein